MTYVKGVHYPDPTPKRLERARKAREATQPQPVEREHTPWQTNAEIMRQMDAAYLTGD